MAFDHVGAQAAASDMITRFGSAAVLRRGATDRDCIAAILDYNPRGRDLVLEGARRALVAAAGLTIPPNHELDVLVVGGSVYRIVEPAKGPRPGGTVIFFDLMVMYDSPEA
jgi:hypothetical protein